MKKLALASLAALVAYGTACSDAGTVAGPEGPQFELTNPDDRLAAEAVNAHVYGTFSITFEASGGTGAITSGPANFPGNPKNAGECDDGLWINARGKRTSGSLENPHPHCVGETSESVQVVLEPISAEYGTFGRGGQELVFSDDEELRVHLTGGGDHMRGDGVVEAYAILASTLGDTNERVGILTFDLDQYHSNNTDYFADDCALDDSETAPQCLDLIISADYAPLSDPDGVGEATDDVQGFLYWSDASEPFNYDGD